MRHWRIPLLALLALAAAAPVSGAGFNAVYSRDGTDVWAVGNAGLVWRSLNSGATYASFTLGNKPLHGVATGGITVLAVGDSGKVWRSADYGNAWGFTVPSTTAPLRAVAMPSASVAYAVGDNGRILKSVNGGSSWSAQTSGTAQHLRAIAFASDDDVWVVGHGGTVLHTTNGGTNWNTVAAGTSNDLLAVGLNGSTVWVTGKLGTARKSTNGGANWSAVDLRMDSHSDVRAVRVMSTDSVAVAGGGGFVRISADAGSTWTFPVQPLFGSASSACFVGQNGWVANGDTSMVIRTTNGGATWSMPTGATRAASWNFKFNVGGTNDKRGNTFSLNWQNPNTLYCMIIDRVYVSRDRGETWATIGNAVSNSLRVNAFIVSPYDSTEWIAAVTNPDRIVRTSNSGTSWTTVRTDNFSEYGTPIEMHPDRPDTLYFGPDNDVLYRSIDFGDTWSAYSNTSFRSPCDIIVVPESDSATILVGDGVTSVGNGEIFRATNGSLNFTINHTGAGTASEIPSMAVNRLAKNRIFATQWAGPDALRSTDEGLTWPSITAIAGVSSTWGSDIAKDDPNVVVIDRFGGSTSFLSYDGGVNWDTIVKSGSNYGVFIADRGNAYKLQSTGIFKLKHVYTYVPGSGAQSISLGAPDGGEIWDAGSMQSVTWSAANVALAQIDYRIDGGAWTPVATVPGYQGSYAWQVPMTPSVNAEVRVRDAWDGAPSDVSAAVFTIAAPQIAATPDPVDFGMVEIGMTGVQVVTIENDGTAALDVTSATVGTPFFALSRSSLTVPAGQMDTLTVLFDPAAAIAYDDTLDLAHNAPGGLLRVPITGQGMDVPAIDLTAPDGGEQWTYGTSQHITWTSVAVDSVRIEYRSDNALPWTVLETSFPADSNGYTWVIPDDPGTMAGVRVSQVGGDAADSSAAAFAIVVPRLVISPTYMDLGLVQVGQTYVQKVTLFNTGTGTLDVSDIQSDDTDFSPSANSALINETTWDSIFVTFAPLTTGPDTATITFTTNGPLSPVTLVLTGEGTNLVDVGGDVPLSFALGQNQPNPFTRTTMIRYALPVKSHVELDVFDLQGKRVARLAEGEQAPGHYSVPFGSGARTIDGRLTDVRAGVYFYRLRAGSFVATRKMLLLH